MFTTPTTIILTRAELLALLAHACRDETREHMHGLRFVRTAHSVNVVATDGHRLAKLGGAVGGVEWSATVPYDVCREAAKAAGAKGCVEFCCTVWSINVYAFRNGLGPVGPVERVLTYTPIEQAFPPYAQVIPADRDANHLGAPVCMDADYFADLALVQAAANEKHEPQPKKRGHRPTPKHGISCYTTIDPLDPILFRCVDWTVVLMPMRGDFDRDCVKARRAAMAKVAKAA
jgi:hypothetical protein